MYTPPFFKQGRAASLKFAEERGFGTFAPSTATSRSPRRCRST